MNLHRLLQPDLIRLELETPLPEPLEGEETLRPMQIRAFKETVLEEIADLFAETGAVGHRNRLLRDLINRERRATTAVGQGIAFPHVHTDQAKDLLVAVLRAPEGIPFDAPDGEPVRLIVAMIAPHDADRAYLGLVRRFSEMFLGDAVLPEVMAAKTEYEVIRALERYL